jgi:hypothetical protein
MTAIPKDLVHSLTETAGKILRVFDVNVEVSHVWKHLEQFHNPFTFQGMITGSARLDIDASDNMNGLRTAKCFNAASERYREFLKTTHIEREPTELILDDERAKSLAGKTKTFGRCRITVFGALARSHALKDVLEEFSRKSFESRRHLEL